MRFARWLWILSLREQLSQYVLQDSAVAVVGSLGRGVDPHGDIELRRGVARHGPDGDLTRHGS